MRKSKKKCAARHCPQSPSDYRYRSATAPLLALRATSPVSGESVHKWGGFSRGPCPRKRRPAVRGAGREAGLRGFSPPPAQILLFFIAISVAISRRRVYTFCIHIYNPANKPAVSLPGVQYYDKPKSRRPCRRRHVTPPR